MNGCKSELLTAFQYIVLILVTSATCTELTLSDMGQSFSTTC